MLDYTVFMECNLKITLHSIVCKMSRIPQMEQLYRQQYENPFF